MRQLSTLLSWALMLVFGVIAFGAHQFYLSPDERLSYVADVIDRYYPTASSATPTVETRITILQSCENKLWTILTRYHGHSIGQRVTDGDHVDTLIDKINNHRTSLLSDGNLTDTQFRVIKLLDMRAHFVASQITVGRYKEPFLARAQAVIEGPSDKEDVALADYLVFLCQHEYNASASADLLRELNEFVERYPNGHFGPLLFSTVSHQFWLHGQGDSATNVLELAIKTFQGQSCLGLLINQMANQQIIKASESPYGQMDWQVFADGLKRPS